jgi:NAD-dependent SIR2 family protein deacetylase
MRFKQKSITEKEVAFGHWNTVMLHGGFAEEWGCVCSECGCTVSENSRLGKYKAKNQQLNYCPNCGKPMEAE